MPEKKVVAPMTAAKKFAAPVKQPIVRKPSMGARSPVTNKFVAPKAAAAPVKKAVVAPIRKPALPARPVIAKKVAAK